MEQKEVRSCPTTDMWVYSLGEVPNSLLFNTISAFAMLFYTDALGLSPIWAGWAMSIAMFWDAISDPLMGHISDNTRSRFGRRHQYILFGGIVMLVAFFFMWAVPAIVQQTQLRLFWYLVTINLLVRTSYTVFIVPFTALGFEMTQNYTGRTKIQSIRTLTNMIANFCGPALAWALFFPKEGVSVKEPSNYLNMATAFSIVSLIAILAVVFFTQKYRVDSRGMKIEGSSPLAFFRDMKEIITDAVARWVFGFAMLVFLGVGLVASLQMYLYEHFMHLSGLHKTLTHGGTMVGMMLGAVVCSRLVTRFDKKVTVFFGVMVTLACGITLATLFVGLGLKPSQTLVIAGVDFPFAMAVFAVFNALYWFGNGIMLPVATSMMADISEINEIKTGINKDGAYSAMYSLSMKVAVSISSMLVGYVLTWIGFRVGPDMIQSHDTVIKLFLATFVLGPLISIAALALIKMYPVSKSYLDKLRAEPSRHKEE